MVERCVRSCLDQSFRDVEVVAVDDGSEDGSRRLLTSILDDRLTVIWHETNRGICPARNTGVLQARGRWIISLDSDHSLRPSALETLYAATRAAGPEVGVIGARYLWDTGLITPAFVPPDVIDYRGRVEWIEEEGGSDYLCCVRREAFETVKWPSDRRGPLDTLFQLDLARQWKARILEDVLALEYSDAHNSATRSRGARRVRTLLRDAADMAWHYEEILRLHGDALRAWGPKQYISLHRSAALYHYLAGARRAGLRRILHYLRSNPVSLPAWGILVLGSIGPRWAAAGNALKNWQVT